MYHIVTAYCFKNPNDVKTEAVFDAVGAQCDGGSKAGVQRRDRVAGVVRQYVLA
jgi:hypothetical protein